MKLDDKLIYACNRYYEFKIDGIFVQNNLIGEQVA